MRDMPRWVKVFAVVGILLVIAFAGVHLAGGGLGSLHTLPDGGHEAR